MKRPLHALKHIAGVLAVFLGMSVCWSIAFFVTHYLYHWFGVQPQDFTRQLINSLLGFLLFGVSMALVGTMGHPRRRAVFHLITDALRQIAKGNYNVNVKINADNNHPFGQIAETINSMAVELHQIEQMRQEFISNVSHEIQSPLTSISGFARALHNKQLSEEQRIHYLTIIETESMRLSKLSDNLMKLTSLESRHHPFDRKQYRLDKQLRNLVLACEPQWVDKALEMDISLDEVTIVADEDLLSQVWVNLLNNSIKFTPHGGTIGVTLRKRDGQAIVAVSDSGIGISQEDQAHIFERFYKADESRNRASGGSGLGLSIVKKIIELHHGTISVQSKPDEGATFTVKLPLERN